MLCLHHLDLLHLLRSLLVLHLQILLQLVQNLRLEPHPHLGGCLLDRSGRQVQVEAFGKVEPGRLSVGDVLRNLLPVGFVSAVVLDLDMQVEGPLGPIELLAFVVGAFELPLDVVCAPTIVLFPA